MPMKPLKPCKHPGCPNLSDKSYCQIHTDDRPSAAARGYDSRWRKARLRFLKVHPFCVTCKAEGKLIKATVVDHVVPHRGDELLFWDESNWQALCKRCHDRKTMMIDRPNIYRY
ncbi:5-methylcytosine-specific restriction protein A [Acetoanaerobium pronyense]|uniref:Putative HNH nuclease YajD n=1 Tax=Acetoanaerobium pronyense TaxID=1482736 RepID=A0ABS4KNZ7_9FIRM|nr:HNH endonuclease [Acetoanaerobium pronyense]MBP2028861.1 5-methylcytosine-specific restriction protein A [Acetoanaerobium pronyense]